MSPNERKINVYGDWEALRQPTLVGTLTGLSLECRSKNFDGAITRGSDVVNKQLAGVAKMARINDVKA